MEMTGLSRSLGGVWWGSKVGGQKAGGEAGASMCLLLWDRVRRHVWEGQDGWVDGLESS